MEVESSVSAEPVELERQRGGAGGAGSAPSGVAVVPRAPRARVVRHRVQPPGDPRARALRHRARPVGHRPRSVLPPLGWLLQNVL